MFNYSDDMMHSFENCAFFLSLYVSYYNFGTVNY